MQNIKKDYIIKLYAKTTIDYRKKEKKDYIIKKLDTNLRLQLIQSRLVSACNYNVLNELKQAAILRL